MTILFQDDWRDKYPNAIVHTTTKNQSFIRICSLLKEMGIKNHLFPLQLHNPELLYVDPFDPHLSLEEMTMIAIEAKTSVFYTARELLRDPKGSIHSPIPFRANRFNMSMYWLYMTHITTLLQIARQQGKSFAADGLNVWLLNIATTNTNINLLTKDDKLRSENLIRLKGMIEELPGYMQQLSRNDIANTEEVHIKSLNNRLTGYLPSKSPKQALNVARGSSSANNFIDEIAFIYNIAISLPSMLATGTAARETAKDKGEPYGTLLYTTAGKKDDPDGKYVYNMLQDSARWSERMFDVRNQEELEDLIRRNSPGGKLRVFVMYNHRQLGVSDEQFRRAIENSEATGEERDRDWYGKWTSGSQTSPLTPEMNDIIRASEVLDYYTEITSPYAYIIRWYVPEISLAYRMASGQHIASLDTSDAAGGDDIGLTFRDVKTGETIGAGNYNETNLISFAEWLCQLLATYPNLTMIIERRSSGIAILDYMLLMLPKMGIDPFKRLYNKVVQEADENRERYLEICKPLHARPEDIYTRHKKAFGFATSATGATSRSELYSTTLLKAARLTGDKARDSALINQILGLVIKNNRVDHADGEKDDLVISWLLSMWLITMGRNLQHYGINHKDLLSENTVNQTENKPVDVYDRQYNDYVRQQIEILVEDIRRERDPYIVINLENKLKLMYNKLCEQDRQMFAVDELINSLRENRRSGQSHRAMYR